LIQTYNKEYWWSGKSKERTIQEFSIKIYVWINESGKRAVLPNGHIPGFSKDFLSMKKK
jgi:hypothetical protein